MDESRWGSAYQKNGLLPAPARAHGKDLTIRVVISLPFWLPYILWSNATHRTAFRKSGSERGDELKRHVPYIMKVKLQWDQHARRISKHLEGVTSIARLVNEVLAVFVRDGCDDTEDNVAFHRDLPAGNSGMRGVIRNSWAPAAISRRQKHAQGEKCPSSGPSKKELGTVLSKGLPLFPHNIALRLPLETLSNLKDISCLQRGGGIKLHLDAVRDSSGVTLTIATSGQSSGSLEDDGSDAVLRSVPQSTEVRSMPDFATDSRSALTSEPLPASQRLQNHIFGSMDLFGPTNFDDTLLDYIIPTRIPVYMSPSSIAPVGG
ncbi:hypothetical protein B0H17DRAFT_1133883 [Mycena rosella]|uniref:Uncharacterized protein n=1 Tax=Mycena rosella TaxID=1033263 RepID=A0AAD7DHG5_MYCRO|nr:hypothetical protein B0H17DRAFT_1133883 [Mycena rosella]